MKHIDGEQQTSNVYNRTQSIGQDRLGHGMNRHSSTRNNARELVYHLHVGVQDYKGLFVNGGRCVDARY